MKSIVKIIEWAYLVIALVFIVEIIRNWSEDRQKAYVSIAMAALAIFMFIFKRRFRNKRM